MWMLYNKEKDKFVYGWRVNFNGKLIEIQYRDNPLIFHSQRDLLETQKRLEKKFRVKLDIKEKER